MLQNPNELRRNFVGDRFLSSPLFDPAHAGRALILRSLLQGG